MNDTNNPNPQAARQFLRALGHEIRSQRELQGKTRKEIAEAVGVSGTTLGRIERSGPADVGVTWRLAEALGIRLPDLVRRAEENAARVPRVDVVYPDAELDTEGIAEAPEVVTLQERRGGTGRRPRPAPGHPDRHR